MFSAYLCSVKLETPKITRMEGTFYIKHVGQMQSITNQKTGEQIAKLSIVISTKEVRMSDSGPYAIDQDLCVDLLGERATGFALVEGDWLAGSVSFTARQYEGTYYQDIRLTRYVKLT